MTTLLLPDKCLTTELKLHCKPKPCKAYRELPVSQLSQGKPCFHYMEPCSHCRDPVFITGISLENPVLPRTGLQWVYICSAQMKCFQEPLVNPIKITRVLPHYNMEIHSPITNPIIIMDLQMPLGIMIYTLFIVYHPNSKRLLTGKVPGENWSWGSEFLSPHSKLFGVKSYLK